MILYNVTWNSSETKKIYRATKDSEILMEYLEQSLEKANLIKLIGEHPVPDKGREYGVMIYYFNSSPKRKLLTAAPRRNNNYIHIELFSRILTREVLESFNLGNARDPIIDLKVHSVDEIDRLIELLKANFYKV
ncbi:MULTISPECIES: hypothetical protein [unclassified Bacillus (in: firmicutes)]|uniref:hypothetical protein n=1 Tax=unclassified Bacillus (in: firmicutes) TaxID=185979 RepID=UPI0008EADAEE|nr:MULTISPECIES: hypothetical protein [unclassified Bacillus (in: firmicutes)]SFB19924.1 hypothetical protein SAMN02799634_10847 [Bacillus sp. UNCCL13]SFQ90786.1 hypothetical protein SAMN04488577_3863 [Bacillus sp. cl95]